MFHICVHGMKLSLPDFMQLTGSRRRGSKRDFPHLCEWYEPFLAAPLHS